MAEKFKHPEINFPSNEPEEKEPKKNKNGQYIIEFPGDNKSYDGGVKPGRGEYKKRRLKYKNNNQPEIDFSHQNIPDIPTKIVMITKNKSGYEQEELKPASSFKKEDIVDYSTQPKPEPQSLIKNDSDDLKKDYLPYWREKYGNKDKDINEIVFWALFKFKEILKNKAVSIISVHRDFKIYEEKIKNKFSFQLVSEIVSLLKSKNLFNGAQDLMDCFNVNRSLNGIIDNLKEKDIKKAVNKFKNNKKLSFFISQSDIDAVKDLLEEINKKK